MIAVRRGREKSAMGRRSNTHNAFLFEAGPLSGYSEDESSVGLVQCGDCSATAGGSQSPYASHTPVPVCGSGSRGALQLWMPGVGTLPCGPAGDKDSSTAIRHGNPAFTSRRVMVPVPIRFSRSSISTTGRLRTKSSDAGLRLLSDSPANVKVRMTRTWAPRTGSPLRNGMFSALPNWRSRIRSTRSRWASERDDRVLARPADRSC